MFFFLFMIHYRQMRLILLILHGNRENNIRKNNFPQILKSDQFLYTVFLKIPREGFSFPNYPFLT